MAGQNKETKVEGKVQNFMKRQELNLRTKAILLDTRVKKWKESLVVAVTERTGRVIRPTDLQPCYCKLVKKENKSVNTDISGGERVLTQEKYETLVRQMKEKGDGRTEEERTRGEQSTEGEVQKKDVGVETKGISLNFCQRLRKRLRIRTKRKSATGTEKQRHVKFSKEVDEKDENTKKEILKKDEENAKKEILKKDKEKSIPENKLNCCQKLLKCCKCCKKGKKEPKDKAKKQKTTRKPIYTQTFINKK